MRFQLVLLLAAACTSATGNETAREQSVFCWDRFGKLNVTSFERRSCVMCFSYLFRTKIRPTIQSQPSRNDSAAPTNAPAAAVDVTESVSSWPSCASLSNDECARWRACCEAAGRCCERQQTAGTGAVDAETGGPQCRSTWDGYRCWGATKPGVTATGQCPYYIGHSITTRNAVKRCNDDGTWFQRDGVDWTDYTSCLDKQGYLIGVYISLFCCVVSVCLLVPAVVIFVVFRDLHKQHRVRLHENFFLALTFNALVNILWYTLVHHNLLSEASRDETVLYRNPTWCRFLSFAKIFFTSSGYFWMFCEGYYLHRLISNAFEPPKSLVPLYLLGWGVPSIPCVIYSVIRGTKSNSSCWAISYGAYEWIIYIPNLICLVVNLVFVGNILRILLFQMHSHPHEPSNFRRGLKAVFMLTPLFGLQMFVTIYRPPPGAPGEREYEYVNFIITGSQGVFVSLIFCFFNGEVLVHLRRLCRRCGFERPSRQPFHTTQTTQVWTADDARPPLLVAPPPPADDRDTRNGGVAHDLEMHDLEPHDLETTEPAAHAWRSNSGTDADRAPSAL